MNFKSRLTLNTVVRNSTAMHQSRRLIGSCTLRRLRYHQHRLRFKLEYCGHKAMVGTVICMTGEAPTESDLEMYQPSRAA